MATVHEDFGRLYANLPISVQILLSPNGRMNRAEYAVAFFGGIAFFLVLPIALTSLANAFGITFNGARVSGLLLFLIIAWVVLWKWITIVALVKRLHDMDWPGALCLLVFVPFVGLLLYLLVFLGDGTAKENKYGLPTRFFEPRVIPKTTAH